MGAITIHESVAPNGQRLRTRLVSNEDGQLSLEVGGDTMPLPEGALEAVMKRYGKPLGIGEDELVSDETLALGGGRTLVRFRFMPRWEVIAKDYLVLLEPGAEALCELATAVTAALDHLARRFAQ